MNMAEESKSCKRTSRGKNSQDTKSVARKIHKTKGVASKIHKRQAVADKTH